MMKNMASKLNVPVNGFNGIKQNRSPAFTLIELMIVVMILGVLAATATSAFKTYVLRSKTTEALQGISKMVQSEIVYYEKNSTFLSAGPSNIPPSATKVTVDFTADPNWSTLAFGFGDAIQYGYQATATAGNSVDCEAQGDLNGDGITSLFQRNVTRGTTFVVGSVVTFDELE